MTYRQKALNKLKERRDMLIDVIIVRTVAIVAVLSTCVSLAALVSNWETIAFIFGG